MKNSWSILFFGLPITIVLFVVNYFFMSSAFNAALIKALIMGTIAGLIFWYILNFLSKRMSARIHIELQENETMVFEDPANHFVGKEGVGGKLFLTNERLVFKSHSFNVQNHEYSIPTKDIAGFDTYNSMGMIKNGLIIYTASQQQEKFVVNDLQSWSKHIKAVVVKNATLYRIA